MESQNKQTPTYSLALYLLFPGIAMLLGWGLRGYIGGGPFAAMIPGAFLALSLSLLLNHDKNTAAMLALFGAVGIAYGGEMTYGQTLGLARNPETMAWGFLGVTLKGAIWGLLGGAVLGAGFNRNQYAARHLIIAFLLTIIASYIGWKCINEPKLIYFSDPINNPRDESWAGLLLAALAFLAYLSRLGDCNTRWLPAKFALWGLVSGGIGFGCGTLFLAFGPLLPVPQAWFGWWKAMEFFFGLMLGLGFGACTYLHREVLKNMPEALYPERSAPCIQLLLLIVLVLVFFAAFPWLDAVQEQYGDAVAGMLAGNASKLLYTFVFFGAICMMVGLHSPIASWQVAIVITFFHTVFDFNINIPGQLGMEPSPWTLLTILILANAAMAVAVWQLHKRQNAIANLYMLLLWACYAMALIKGVMHAEYFQAGGIGAAMRLVIQDHPSILPVQAIFLVTTLFTAFCILRINRNNRAA